MDAQATYAVAVLGCTTLHAGDREVPLTPAEARVLTALALAGSTGAAEDRLLDAVWGEHRPATARHSLHNHVSRLRQKAAGAIVARTRTGYRLAASVAVDVRELDRLLTAVRAADDDGDAEEVIRLASRAIALIGGSPLADLPDDPVAAAARARIDEAVLHVRERSAARLISTGRPERAVADLQQLVIAAPSRERGWELLLTSLRDTGRRSEALEVYHRARRALIDAHGTEPGGRLRRLHESMLQNSGPARAAGPGEAPVGRQADIAALIGAAREGRSTVLTGQAGIGKSTLLRLVARAWPGPAVVLDCRENPWTALGPVQDLLDRLAGPLEALGLPADLQQLRPAVAEPWDGPRRHGGLIGRATEVIAAGLGALGSPLVLIDDLDRAGPTTREVLVTALQQAAVPGIFVTRADADGLGVLDAEEHGLGGLDAASLTALAAQHTTAGREGLPPTVGPWLHRHTGGHPMFARELLRAVADRRPWEHRPEDDRATGPVDPLAGVVLPPSLVASLRRRLEQLPPACRPVLDAAAVVDDPLDLPLLRSLVDIGVLADLVDAGVLVRTGAGQVRFEHALLRRVAYDQVPAGRRQELHHAVGLLSTDPLVRAHHLRRSLPLDPAAAIAAMAVAGRAALSEHAYADAAEWFEEAAAHAAVEGAPAQRVLELRLEACDSARLAGRPGHAPPLLDLAEEVLDTGHLDLRRRAAVAAVQLGEVVDPGPQQRRAAALADRAVAQEEDRGWRARLRATGSILHSMTGDAERCRSMFLAALADVDADEDRLACDVLPYAYLSLGHPDDLGQREAVAARLAEAAARTDDHAALWEANHLRWSTCLIRGDGPGVRQALRACTRLLAHVGDAGRRWSVGYMGAALAAIEGRDADAERLSAEAMAVGSGVAPGRAMSVHSAQLLALRWRQGRLDDLVDAIRHLIEAQPEVAAWQAAGSLVLAAQAPDLAGDLFDRAAADGFAAIPRDFTWLAAMVVLAGGAVRLADPDRAALMSGQLAPYASLVCWQGSCSLGPVAGVLADLAALRGQDARAADLRATADRLEASLAGR